ncbi:hypothetical protein PaecuDRAFT_3182 [Paenibacillus curdlanolyticus YK9]|uniref:Uncharacterized protein n=1 Tax=Paenibacillus curdlanolyticus YK9 TaxID=717606 RepID=E0IBZ3_9BACL|nr:hypothetical protein [Paenibacillus curdlanolyticus]EFM10223.1 hypothetical protein PaecuDRAFT_3182 [Paenibacillus curdlanolyticus YK9]
MRRNKRIDVKFVQGVNPLDTQLEQMLQDSNATIDEYPPIAVIIQNLYADTDAYQSLQSFICENKLEYTEYEYREYKKKELNEADYFDVKLHYPWGHVEKSALDHGTKYDDRNKCPKCGEGKYQITDLIIDTKKMGKRQIAFNYPDIIVTEQTRSVIEENQLTGCKFREVIERKGLERTNIFQLVPTQVLDPMNLAKMRLVKHQYCDDCYRGAVLRSEIIYPKASLLYAKDFNYSMEYYGFGTYCTRRLIVSSKVRKVFMENKIRLFEYEPIVIES